jgi:hypothetical protein
MSDAGNILFEGPIGCQMRRIFSSRDQEDVRCGEYSLPGTNRMSDAEKILFKGPIGGQMRTTDNRPLESVNARSATQFGTLERKVLQLSPNFETARNAEIVDVSMNFSALNTTYGITCSFEIT